ncbi:hypothetical protein L9F63_018212, partial [Diploptera punctata]
VYMDRTTRFLNTDEGIYAPRCGVRDSFQTLNIQQNYVNFGFCDLIIGLLKGHSNVMNNSHAFSYMAGSVYTYTSAYVYIYILYIYIYTHFFIYFILFAYTLFINNCCST